MEFNPNFEKVRLHGRNRGRQFTDEDIGLDAQSLGEESNGPKGRRGFSAFYTGNVALADALAKFQSQILLTEPEGNSKTSDVAAEDGCEFFRLHGHASKCMILGYRCQVQSRVG